jgi:SAM-dependent methyltransferase
MSQQNLGPDKTTGKTIEDFGEQWGHYQDDNHGYYASQALLSDLAGPLLSVTEFQNARIADIGSGTGRIVKMLAGAGAAEIIAVEPSAAVEALKKNLREIKTKITIQNVTGDEFIASGLDLAVSFGVLHHVPDPDPVVKKVLQNLKPGGKFLIWLYGKEGNELYLRVFEPVRRLTTKTPHWVLEAVSVFLAGLATVYGVLGQIIPLPMRSYFKDHFLKLAFKVRVITVYDQLNPQYAKYYTRSEAVNLLERNGFTSVATFHRHGYSWTVIGSKP